MTVRGVLANDHQPDGRTRHPDRHGNCSRHPYDIVTQQHGGTIEVDSRLGEFTEFTIRLPREAVGGAV